MWDRIIAHPLRSRRPPCHLFCKFAFPSCNWPNETVKELGEELVKRCSGLPVAILALAGLMSTKGDDPAKWRDALKSLDYYSAEFEEGGSLKCVNRALLLSYNELPTHLKPCFLYCAMFPKAHGVGVEELIRMCIAEGFINEDNGGTTLEAIARDYFIQLNNRSLIQMVTKDTLFDGEYQTIQIHDLYRDVACEVIRREMFAEIIKLEQSSSRKLEWKQRRSFIVVEGKPKSVDQLDNCYENMKKLRTLIINNCEGIITVNSFPQMLQNMKLLRVLWLERLPDAIKGLANEVGDLIHLRYLSLSGNRYMRDLPDSLGRLHNLQTLDLRNTRVNSLPKSMSELKQLRHLFGNCNLVPDIVFTLSQLQTLSDILITTTQARELVNLTQLTLLEIGFDGAESWREICNSVKEMAHLRSLRISSTMYSRLKFENFSPPPSLEKLKFQNLGKLVKFTSTANYLRSLITQWCNIGEDFFNNLEKLPSLEYLHINFYNGQQLLCSGGSFPKLKKLTIMCSKVTKWEIGEGAMKCLESLSIHDCNCLEMLPEGLRELEYLKELHLVLPSQQLVQGISVEGSDRWKIERILRVSIIQKVIIQKVGEKPFLLS